MKILSILRQLVIIVTLVLFASSLIYFGFQHERFNTEHSLYDYYRANFYNESGTQNAVVAILLTYRMYDTIFEAIILLASVIGIMHFLPAVEKKTSTTMEDSDDRSKRQE